MKFSKWIFGTALLLSAQMASVQGAYDACEPCDPCYENPCDICDIDFCDAEFDFYVDALYWEACNSNYQAYENLAGDKVKYLDPEYQWGYRIGANASWKCWDMGLRYTSICFDDSRTVPGTEGEDKVKSELDFDVLDIELGYTCCLDCGLVFRPFLGAKLAWVEDKLKDEGDLRDFAEAKIDFEGYGLYAGTSMRWELTSFCACERDIPVALVARASTSILRSTFDEDIDGPVSVDIESRDRCNYVPVHELYAGLDFTFCDLCGWDAFFQVGYETQYWGWTEFASNDDIAHIGMGGLVLRFGASF